MAISFGSLVSLAAILALVGVASTYHIGWKRGWQYGFRDGSGTSSERRDGREQPSIRTLLVLPYALGWHHGWDHGFREGWDRKASKESEESRSRPKP